MWTLINQIKHPSNAKIEMAELLRSGVPVKGVVVYDLEENHVVCARDEGGPSVAQKYHLSNEVVDVMRSNANGRFAALAYTHDGGVAYLDSVPEMPIACCLLTCIISVFIGGGHTACETPTPEYREDLRPLRDERGRFVKVRHEDRYAQGTAADFEVGVLSTRDDIAIPHVGMIGVY